jgi:hypothetical protein
MSEWIIGESLRQTDIKSLVREVSFGEIVTVNNSEHSRINIEICAESQICPVVISRLVWFRQLVSLEENSLWDSCVLYSALDDVDGVVIKVIVKNALADSVVLIWVFNNWFLEVDFEIKYLSIVLEPLGSNFGDGIVLLCLAFGDATVVHGNTFTHGLQ